MSEPLIDEYLGSLQVERGAALNTLLAYRRDLAGFERFLAHERRRLDAVAVSDLSRYLATLRRRGLGSRSVARHLSAVRGLLRFACREGILIELRRTEVPVYRLEIF